MSSNVCRRRFLKELALSSIGLPLLSRIAHADRRGGLRLAGTPKNIVVLGAGLAGLSAAFELQNAGHNVTLIEARKTVGGRVRTIRGVFNDGQYAEAGALSFPQSHTFTYGYATDFNLPLRPVFKVGLGQIGDLGGSVFRINPDGSSNIPLSLKAAERQAGIYGLISLYLGQYLANVGNPRKAGWPPPDIAQLDGVSCRDLLTSLGASDNAITVMQALGIGLLGFGISSVSALDTVFTESITTDQPFFEVIGGNDLLPAAFRQRFNGTFKKKSTVQSINQDQSTVTVTYLHAGTVQNITADFAVCALPFSILKDIAVAPSFSAAKQQAINNLAMTPVTRTYLQFSSRLWEQNGYDGDGVTDLEIQNTYSPSLTQSGASGILTSYAAGQNALDLAQLSESAREHFVLGKLNNLFPGVKGLFETGTSMIWQDDPYAKGAFVYFQPGQMTTLLPAAQQPEGLIHFAGEHTSAWHGWMNGALESGSRAAAEIVQAASQQSIWLHATGKARIT